MISDSVRMLQARRDALTSQIERSRAIIRTMEEEIEQIDRGIRAMYGDKLPPKGHMASRNAVAHFARRANPLAQSMTIKKLVVTALNEHLQNGATSQQLLDVFAREWGRTDIIRTSLSPQLSRLKSEGVIDLDGKIWTLVHKETGEAETSPEVDEASTSSNESQGRLLDLD